jgi:hypothetical protein
MKPTAIRIQRDAQVKPRSVAVAAARGPVPADLARPLEGKSRIARPVPAPQPIEPVAAAAAGDTASSPGGAEGGKDAYEDFMASLKSLGAY